MILDQFSFESKLPVHGPLSDWIRAVEKMSIFISVSSESLKLTSPSTFFRFKARRYFHPTSVGLVGFFRRASTSLDIQQIPQGEEATLGLASSKIKQILGSLSKTTKIYALVRNPTREKYFSLAFSRTSKELNPIVAFRGKCSERLAI